MVDLGEWHYTSEFADAHEPSIDAPEGGGELGWAGEVEGDRRGRA